MSKKQKVNICEKCGHMVVEDEMSKQAGSDMTQTKFYWSSIIGAMVLAGIGGILIGWMTYPYSLELAEWIRSL